MITAPLAQALFERLRLLAAAQRVDVEQHWILPRARPDGPAAAVVVRTVADAERVFDGQSPLVEAEAVATCAVASNGGEEQAFRALDVLQHAAAHAADDGPPDRSGVDVGDWPPIPAIVSARRGATEWGETERGDVKICEVRIRLRINENNCG